MPRTEKQRSKERIEAKFTLLTNPTSDNFSEHVKLFGGGKSVQDRPRCGRNSFAETKM
jgi:hypothetical protein